jgi:hypothetical protein
MIPSLNLLSLIIENWTEELCERLLGRLALAWMNLLISYDAAIPYLLFRVGPGLLLEIAKE